ncbi:MAG: hypothetical protein EHM48_06385 [Planctomycetaceae bacterium]|nr:MAG: hypothetical protein EHM48_06385 [Planctomycetaceae bacterium]
MIRRVSAGVHVNKDRSNVENLKGAAMSKLAKLILCAVVVVSWSSAVQAQDSLNAQQSAQSKLLAYRAARVDAMRKLAERVQGLRITSETTVKDFVAENDQIATSMQAFLMGAQEVGKPKYMEDGTCSVKMMITLTEVITELEKIHKAKYKGDKFKVSDFQKMTVTNTLKEIEETGSGAPRPALETGAMITVKSGEDIVEVAYPASAKAFWMAHVTGQGRLMAVRAARVDAMRRLAERIKGLQITSDTQVKDFVAESDNINTVMNTFLVGAKETGIRYHDDELIVDVQMQIKLRTVIANMNAYVEEHYKGNSAKIKQFAEYSTRVEDTIITETGNGVPPAKYLKDVTPAQTAIMDMAVNAPGWASQTISAKGSAAIDPDNDNKAQAKLMAFRAAELDARRKLAEEVNGLVIRSKTTVQDFVAESDKIRTDMMTFQQGARVIEESKKVMDDGTVSVTVELDLAPLWDMVMYYQKNSSVKTGPGGTVEKSSEKIIIAPRGND